MRGLLIRHQETAGIDWTDLIPTVKRNLATDSILEQLRAVRCLAVGSFVGESQMYAAYMETGLNLTGLDRAEVSHVANGVYTILASHPSDVDCDGREALALQDTFSARVIAEERPVAVDCVAADPELRQRAVYMEGGNESWICAPICFDGLVIGTLSFTGTEPRRPDFSAVETEIVGLLACGLGEHIARHSNARKREAAEARLRETIELFESAFQHAPVGKALVATDGRWLRANPALTTFLGYSDTELIQGDFQRLTHPDDLHLDLAYMRELLAGERDSYRLEKRYLHREGHVVWGLLSVALVRDDDGNARYFVSQILDITERKRTESVLEQRRQALEHSNRHLSDLASRDSLTGLANRHAFERCLSDALIMAEHTELPVSLLLIDVDHFKAFNDGFGHVAGDEALRQVANALLAAARDADTVARYGGEEFAVILGDTDEVGSEVVGERMRCAIAAIDNVNRSMTASIGAATLLPPHDSSDRQTRRARLILRADEALYAAKGAGRNQVRWCPVSAAVRG